MSLRSAAANTRILRHRIYAGSFPRLSTPVRSKRLNSATAKLDQHHHSSRFLGDRQPVITVSCRAMQTSSDASTQEESTGFSAEEVDALRKYITCDSFREPVWGFVIYRCSGRNQEAWEKIVQGLREEVKEILGRNRDQGDLLQAHDLHVIDDERLYGATHHEVRRHFHEWTQKSLQQRLRPDADTQADPWLRAASARPRYQHCLFVDDICLESTTQSFPVIKLLKGNWEDPWSVEERSEAVTAPEPWHDGITDYGEEDVGWMYMNAGGFYVERYLDFLRWEWDDVYQRPPYLDCLEWSGYDRRKWFPHHSGSIE